MRKVHHGRNWLLAFATIYEQPSSPPHYRKGDVRVLLGFPNSVLFSCYIQTHSWCAWLTSSLIIMDVCSDFSNTLHNFVDILHSYYAITLRIYRRFLMRKACFAIWN